MRPLFSIDFYRQLIGHVKGCGKMAFQTSVWPNRDPVECFVLAWADTFEISTAFDQLILPGGRLVTALPLKEVADNLSFRSWLDTHPDIANGQMFFNASDAVMGLQGSIETVTLVLDKKPQ